MQGSEAGAVQPLDRVTVGGEEGYASPKVLYPSVNLSFSLPLVFSIFSCQPDSINIKTEVLNVFKSTSLLYTLLLSDITFTPSMVMSPGG